MAQAHPYLDGKLNLMSNWSNEEIAQFKKKVLQKLTQLDERIIEYRELTKPIPPENALGRVSRMDAINNRSVNQAALLQA
jgi:DnaK suppressor protein